MSCVVDDFCLLQGTVDTIWGKSASSHSPDKPNGTTRTEVDSRNILASMDENRAPPSQSNNHILALLQQMQLQENHRAVCSSSSPIICVPSCFSPLDIVHSEAPSLWKKWRDEPRGRPNPDPRQSQ